MATRWAPIVRGSVTAVLSVFIAAVSHVAGGGSTPGLLGVVLALIAATLACIALARRSLSWVRLAISVSLSQFAFHFLYGLGSAAATMTPAQEHSTHQHGLMVMNVDSAAPGPLAWMADNWSMWLAHATAATVTIILLRRGESAFWSLVALGRTAWAAVFIPRLVAIASLPVSAARVRLAIEDRSGLRNLGVILCGQPHRGPPHQLAISH
jgi:hypothetical protein